MDVDVLVRAEIVGHEAEPAAHAVGIVDDREAVDERVAGGRLVERGQDPHAGRLAGAVGADVAEHLARGDRERHVVHRVRVVEHAMQAAELDLWCGRRGIMLGVFYQLPTNT